MKHLLIIVIFVISYSTVLTGQANPYSWPVFQEAQYNLTFSLPANSIEIVDTTDFKLYSFNLDSTLSTQVHIINNMQFGSNDPVIQSVMSQYGTDTLRAIAEVIMLTTNSSLLSVQNITSSSGYTGLEVTLEYLSLMSNSQTISFIQFYLINNRFFSFTVTGRVDDYQQVSDVKDTFFNSISM